MPDVPELDNRPHRWPVWNREDGLAVLARYVAPEALWHLGLVVERDPDESDLAVARRLFDRLREQRIRYALEPRIAIGEAQLIRHPALLIQDRVGTCLDIATTYAAMCQGEHVAPLLAITHDHAFVVIAPGRFRDDPQARSLFALGSAGVTAERERLTAESGVSRSDPESLERALDEGSILAVDCVAAVESGGDFEAAVASGRNHCLNSAVDLVDVPWLHRPPGFGPLDPPADRPSIRPHVPARGHSFNVYDSRRELVDGLSEKTGIVVLLGPSGTGKSMIAQHLARTAPLGAGWFLDASEPQVLIKSLAEAELRERDERPSTLERLDREGYAENARERLREMTDRWVVVLDNADGDPGKLRRWMPQPAGKQLLLITTTNEAWMELSGLTVCPLPPLSDEEIVAGLPGVASDELVELIELIRGRPLVLDAFRRFIDATPEGAARLVEQAGASGDLPEELRGPAALWAALRRSPDFGERELRLSALAAHLPPDHQPVATLGKAVPGALEAARLLDRRGLLTLAGLADDRDEDRAVIRIHRLFGGAIRSNLEASAPELCDETVLGVTTDAASRCLLDTRGDLETITRLEERLVRIDDGTEGEDLKLGIALHGIAGLLELHSQTRRSGEAYRRAQQRLGPGHPELLADCLHGRARTVNQQHADDEGMLRQAVEWAKTARQTLIDAQGESANTGRYLAMQGLLMQKLASFPREGETELELLYRALAVIEEADELRGERADVDEAERADVDEAERVRSRFNLAGIRIRLARSEPTQASTHLGRAHEVYEEVNTRRRVLYGRDVHPHIAACVLGVGYVDYYRALLVPATRTQRTAWLRSATNHAYEALRQREAMEGSNDLEEVAKCTRFLAKVALARHATPASYEAAPKALFNEAMRELSDARIVLSPVARLPPDGVDLAAAIDRWTHAPALIELVAEFGGSTPEGLDRGGMLAWLDEFSERWDYRRGRERNLVSAPQFDPLREKLVLAATRALGLQDPLAPEGGHYDHVLVLGGLARGCFSRTLHAASLIEKGKITTNSVTALGGFRAIAGDELALVERMVDSGLADEFHVMDAAVGMAFDLRTPVREEGEDSDVVGASWRVREYETPAGVPVRVVAAPSAEPGTRVTTPMSYAWFATELAKLLPAERILLVTTQIYLPYQHADALRMLCLPYGVHVDITGVRPGDVHERLHKAFRPNDYLQEVRSTIRALRALHEVSSTED
jgi:hypothetical protein